MCSVNASVWALSSDRTQAIAIEADKGSLDQKNQVTLFTGNVVVKQGSIYMKADSVQVKQNKNTKAQVMVAQGKPVYFKQQLDGNKGIAEGWGNRVEYDSAKTLVKLVGHAKVQRGGDMAEGEAISYNTQTEVYTVLSGLAMGNKNGRRVNVIIQPVH